MVQERNYETRIPQKNILKRSNLKLDKRKLGKGKFIEIEPKRIKRIEIKIVNVQKK